MHISRGNWGSTLIAAAVVVDDDDDGENRNWPSSCSFKSFIAQTLA